MKEIRSRVGEDEFLENKKTSISIRVEDFTLYCIDKLSKELDGSRAGTVLEIVAEGVLDGLEALGHTLDTLQIEYMQENMKRAETRKEVK
jgi:hypothetical protein